MLQHKLVLVLVLRVCAPGKYRCDIIVQCGGTTRSSARRRVCVRSNILNDGAERESIIVKVASGCVQHVRHRVLCAHNEFIMHHRHRRY